MYCQIMFDKLVFIGKNSECGGGNFHPSSETTGYMPLIANFMIQFFSELLNIKILILKLIFYSDYSLNSRVNSKRLEDGEHRTNTN